MSEAERLDALETGLWTVARALEFLAVSQAARLEDDEAAASLAVADALRQSVLDPIEARR